jgi:hypothetical protein
MAVAAGTIGNWWLQFGMDSSSPSYSSSNCLFTSANFGSRPETRLPNSTIQLLPLALSTADHREHFENDCKDSPLRASITITNSRHSSTSKSKADTHCLAQYHMTMALALHHLNLYLHNLYSKANSSQFQTKMSLNNLFLQLLVFCWLLFQNGAILECFHHLIRY